MVTLFVISCMCVCSGATSYTTTSKWLNRLLFTRPQSSSQWSSRCRQHARCLRIRHGLCVCLDRLQIRHPRVWPTVPPQVPLPCYLTRRSMSFQVWSALFRSRPLAASCSKLTFHVQRISMLCYAELFNVFLLLTLTLVVFTIAVVFVVIFIIFSYFFIYCWPF